MTSRYLLVTSDLSVLCRRQWHVVQPSQSEVSLLSGIPHIGRSACMAFYDFVILSVSIQQNLTVGLFDSACFHPKKLCSRVITVAEPLKTCFVSSGVPDGIYLFFRGTLLCGSSIYSVRYAFLQQARVMFHSFSRHLQQFPMVWYSCYFIIATFKSQRP